MAGLELYQPAFRDEDPFKKVGARGFSDSASNWYVNIPCHVQKSHQESA